MDLLIVFIALGIGIGTIIIMVSLLYHAIFHAPFVPTKNQVVRQMIRAAKLKDGQRVYDLGSGDGRLLIEAMREKKVKATGVEIAWLVSLLARIRMLFSKKKYTLLNSNFFRLDLKDADVIFCYLFPRIMKKLKMKFEKELIKGTKIVSYCFPIKEWQPVQTIQTRADKPKNFLIFVYEIPKCHEK